MSEPIFDTTTERINGRLPDVIRATDANYEWTLKTYISSVGDIASDVDRLIARFDYTHPEDRVDPKKRYEPNTIYSHNGQIIDGSDSDLVSPDRADEGWLPWLAQLVGVPTLNVTTDELRQQIETGGFRAGSKRSIRDAVRSVLSGDKYSVVYPNSNDTDPIGEGGPWDVLVVTKFTETPSPAAVLDAIERKKVKPAGVVIFHMTFSSEWDDVEAAFPTWDDWEGKTWIDIEEVGGV